jgi:diguanylate cyclase (GGDEF)-like protein
LCILEYVSALYYVSEDEFRVVWFLTNIPGVYLLLGQGPGLAVTVLTALGLMLGNAWLPAPYSHNAMATLLFSIVYLGMFFHLFSARALSYYRQLNSSRRQLLQLALHDHLTGVFNARAFYQTCSAQAGLARYAVIFIDLDHFKSVNDTHGHTAGDAVLRVVAALLGGLVRSQDCLGRVGGEEFCIFLPDTDRQTAMQLAAHIREAVAALPIAIADGKSISVTASLGVASHCGSQEDFQQVLQQADSAMYQAKQAGRNRVSCLDAA